MGKIERNGLGAIVLLSDAQEVIALATDGDIRRSLLSGTSMDDSIRTCANRDFLYADENIPREQLLKKLDSRIKFIPLLNKERKLVEIVTREQLPFQAEEPVYTRARAPVRVSFGGGGSDLTHYFQEEKGAVINTTISLYSHATMRLRADDKIVIKSRDLAAVKEYANLMALKVDNGAFRLINAVVSAANPDFGFELYLHSDFPMGSGLGGSAVISAAILGCFNEFRQDQWDQHEIAELAFQAERLQLSISGGWQDQYASVFGGFNFMEFQMEQNIVHPLRIPPDILLELEESLVLCDTGLTHESGKIHDEHRREMQQDEVKRKVQSNVALTYEMRNHLLRGRLVEFARLLHQAWQIKRGLGSKIATSEIDATYEGALRNGAIAGKLLGAGGGGFFLFYAPPYSRHELEDWLLAKGLRTRPFRFDSHGLQSWTVREGRNS